MFRGADRQILYYIDTSPTLVPVNARLTLPYAPPGSRNGNPHNQGVFRALDGNPDTKYLNFGGEGTGLEFDVGAATRVRGIYLTSGNDREDRDPTRVRVEGWSAAAAAYELVADEAVPPFAGRKQEQLVQWSPHSASYTRFRVTFPELNGSNLMQVADIQLQDALGRVAARPQRPPQSYAPPGKENRSPGSQRAPKALDADPDTKYLNFGGAGTGLEIRLPRAAAVDAVALTSGNDFVDRDPVRLKLEGFRNGGYEAIAEVAVPPFTGRQQRQVVMLE